MEPSAAKPGAQAQVPSQGWGYAGENLGGTGTVGCPGLPSHPQPGLSHFQSPRSPFFISPLERLSLAASVSWPAELRSTLRGQSLSGHAVPVFPRLNMSFGVQDLPGWPQDPLNPKKLKKATGTWGPGQNLGRHLCPWRQELWGPPSPVSPPCITSGSNGTL